MDQALIDQAEYPVPTAILAIPESVPTARNPSPLCQPFWQNRHSRCGSVCTVWWWYRVVVVVVPGTGGWVPGYWVLVYRVRAGGCTGTGGTGGVLAWLLYSTGLGTVLAWLITGLGLYWPGLYWPETVLAWDCTGLATDWPGLATD